MNKKEKSEEVKPTMDELQNKIQDVKKLADYSKIMLEDSMKSRPLESAAMIFVAGAVIGVLIGSVTSKMHA